MANTTNSNTQSITSFQRIFNIFKNYSIQEIKEYCKVSKYIGYGKLKTKYELISFITKKYLINKNKKEENSICYHFENKNVNELRAIATKYKIKNYKKFNKNDLINCLEEKIRNYNPFSHLTDEQKSIKPEKFITPFSKV